MPTKTSSVLRLLGAAASIAALGAAPAHAYTHSWGCTTNSAVRCWDAAGVNPNPWELVDAQTVEPHSEICAKAVTPAGNTRTGSRCLTNRSYVRADIAGGYPESVAYVYWAGPYGPFSISLYAAT